MLRLLIIFLIISTGIGGVILVNTVMSQSGSPQFNDVRSFKVYSDNGMFYEFKKGELIEKGKASDFQNGELVFTIVDDDEGILSAQNVGPVEVAKGKNAVTFIERTATGSVHVMTIWNRWDKQKRGWSFIYTRDTTDTTGLDMRLFGVELTDILSVYTGIVRPK